MIRRLAIRFLCSFQKQGYKQSKYYIPKEPVEQFLTKMSVVYKQAPNGLKIRQCPFCMKPHNNEANNLFTLNVHKQSGMFHCFRCSTSGSYLDLKGRILGIDETNHKSIDSNSKVMGVSQTPENVQSGNQSSNSSFVQTSYSISQTQYFAHQQKLFSSKYSDVKTYLMQERGLTQETLNAYKVGSGQETFIDQNGERIQVKVIYFPMFYGQSEKQRKKFRKQINDYIIFTHQSNVKLDDWKINTQFAKLVKYKIRGASSETKQYMRQFPIGSVSGFFGFNLIKEDTRQIVITEGQFDAMSVYQKTGKVALSLPQGASHLPDQLVPLLDKIQKVYLWMDNDKAGELNTPKIAHKLGMKRTFIVQNEDLTLKDANDILRKKPEIMTELLSKATTIPGKNILKFDDLRSRLRNNIFNAQKLQGIPSTVFPFFNKRVKGFRPGQLTILSGGTGSGKTTLLSQLSLDFCQQGVGTLWGSFEIKNDVLAYTMLSQHSKINLKQHKQKFEYYAEKFTNLPLYWLSFYGSTDLQKVFGTIEYAIEKYDVSHVVIDTLQFLLSDQAEGFKKFDLQDSTVGRLRRLATQMNVHVTVVIHPKKVDEGQDLGIHTIFGSSKSAQEADNVWMIQLRQKFKILQIKKNRFDGQLGKVGLGFNKGTKSFFELKKDQIQRLYKGQTTMEEITSQREASKINQKQQQHEQMMKAINPTAGENYNQFLARRKRPF